MQEYLDLSQWPRRSPGRQIYSHQGCSYLHLGGSITSTAAMAALSVHIMLCLFTYFSYLRDTRLSYSSVLDSILSSHPNSMTLGRSVTLLFSLIFFECQLLSLFVLSASWSSLIIRFHPHAYHQAGTSLAAFVNWMTLTTPAKVSPT